MHRSRNIDDAIDRDEARLLVDGEDGNEACGNEVTRYATLETRLPILNIIYGRRCAILQ